MDITFRDGLNSRTTDDFVTRAVGLLRSNLRKIKLLTAQLCGSESLRLSPENEVRAHVKRLRKVVARSGFSTFRGQLEMIERDLCDTDGYSVAAVKRDELSPHFITCCEEMIKFAEHVEKTFGKL